MMQDKQKKDKIRVGILRGGTGEGYEISLKKGGEIILYIHENLADKYKPYDILVDKEGKWHLNGAPIIPLKLLYKVDVVWNTADQSISNILESFSIPNVGVPPFSPFWEGNLPAGRQALREQIKKLGVNMTRHIVLPVYQKDFDGPKGKYAIKKAKEIFEKFSSPWIVRSFTEDKNMAIHLAKTFPELVEAIEDGIRHEKSILVEEFIPGKTASMHSIAGFRNQDVYVFPLLNFSYREKVPTPKGGRPTESVGKKLEELAKKLHQHLGAKHYLKSNFVLTPRGKVYLLQIEQIPDLKPNSHFSQACESVGAKMQQVVEHILESVI